MNATRLPSPSVPNSALAVASLVLGIACWIAIPVIGSLGAIICGHMARRDIRASGGRLAGDGLAVTGLVLGYVHLLFVILAVIAVVLLFGGFAAALIAIGLSGAH